MSEEKEQKKEGRIGWLWSVTIMFVIVLLGSMAIIWFGSNDVAGWDGDTGDVSGECYEYTDTTLSPKGYVSYTHQVHGFKYSTMYESFEYGSDGDSPCDDCNMYDWECELSGGSGIISETRSTEGYRSVKLTYATGSTGIYCNGLTAISGQEMATWVYKDGNCQVGFYYGDGDHAICVFWRQDEEIWAIVDTTSTKVADVYYANNWRYFHFDDINWSANTYDLRLDGVLIANDLGMRSTTGWKDQVAVYAQSAPGYLYLDEFNMWYDESTSGSFGSGGFSLDIDSLEEDTVYYIYPYAMSMWGMYAIGDVFQCKTRGFQDFPLWMAALLVVVGVLAFYTGSIPLGIAGILICVVSYNWVRVAGDEITIWGASALFLIMIAWIILSLIYRQVKKEKG